MENKMKHLEFIQNVITRMNTNSFMIKGWAITLISAIFALAAKDANRLYALVAYIPLPMFWLLDAFFLSQERQYRALYDKVRSINSEGVDFSMDAKSFDKGMNTWCSAFFSGTLLLLYGVLTVVTLVVMFLIT
jgi:hypothetical protein